MNIKFPDSSWFLTDQIEFGFFGKSEKIKYYWNEYQDPPKLDSSKIILNRLHFDLPLFYKDPFNISITVNPENDFLYDQVELQLPDTFDKINFCYLNEEQVNILQISGNNLIKLFLFEKLKFQIHKFLKKILGKNYRLIVWLQE